MKHSHYIVWYTPRALGPGASETAQHLAELEDVALHVCEVSSAPALFAKVNGFHRRGKPIIAVLDAGHPDTRAAASFLNALYPAVGLVAVIDTPNDTKGTELLHTGVDHVCLHTASTAYMAAVLCRLLVRLSHQGLAPPGHHGASLSGAVPQMMHGSPHSPAVGGAPQNQGWALQDRGWALAGPDGIRINLTTRERALLVTLLNSPDLCATHEQLNAAIGITRMAPTSDVRHVRLGVLVSRLRRKFARHQVEMPLKSIHGWGYMFTGHVSS